METFDIIIMIIIILIIMIIFTVNISSILDNKLSNVEINIPPINIPDPQIIVKIQKKCESDDYDIYIEKPTNKTQGTTISLSPISNNEHFNLTNAGETKMQETYQETIQDVNQEGKLKQITQVEKQNNFEEEQISQKIHNKNVKTCNKSLIEQRQNAYQYLLESNSDAIKLPICGSDEYHDIINGDNDEDPSEYHRQYTYYIKSYLEGPDMRGYNVGQYNDNATLDQIGNIDLTNKYKNPKPFGYIFDSSSIYEK